MTSLGSEHTPPSNKVQTHSSCQMELQPLQKAPPTRCNCPSPFAFQTAANARPNAPSLELENEPRLVAEIVLIVVPGGEVVNETRQKIIEFDRPDRQVRSDFNIDATPKHYIQGPIAR